jgi:hypothetical protein
MSLGDSKCNTFKDNFSCDNMKMLHGTKLANYRIISNTDIRLLTKNYFIRVPYRKVHYQDTKSIRMVKGSVPLGKCAAMNILKLEDRMLS